MSVKKVPDGSSSIKSYVGKIVLQINTEILDLLGEYKKVKTGTPLSSKGTDLEQKVKTGKEALEEVLIALEAQEEEALVQNFKKTIKMLKKNIETAIKVLAEGINGQAVPENKIVEAKDEAVKVLEELEKEQKLKKRSLS